MEESPFFTAFPLVELPLSFQEWDRLPRCPAYKYEYFGGRAVLSPRPSTRSAVLDLESFRPVRLKRPPALRTLEEADWEGLPELFYRGFVAELPFLLLEDEAARALAGEVLAYTRRGGDGEMIPEACVMAETDHGPVGAALVTMVDARRFEEVDATRELRPHLTWIFVGRFKVRRGYGSALLGAVVERLRSLGHDLLLSTFLVGSSSALWHWQNGFRLLSRGYRQIWLAEDEPE